MCVGLLADRMNSEMSHEYADGTLADEAARRSAGLITEWGLTPKQSAHGEWISAEERTPNNGVHVLSRSKDGYAVAYVASGIWYHQGTGPLEGVTHWAEIRGPK